MLTLDVEYNQVLIDFPQDAWGFFWHHCLLVVPLGGSVWVGATPDESLQRINLSPHRMVVLRRSAPFPAARLADTYSFDDANFTPALLDRLVSECRALAAVHGTTSAAAAVNDATWRVSDTSHASFGQLIPASVLGDDQLFIGRDSSALVRLENVWLAASKVLDGQSEADFKRSRTWARRSHHG